MSTTTIPTSGVKGLSERDQEYLWHPYTQHKTAALPIAIKRGEGALLWDENNKEYIDAIASWWVNPYGHSNKYIADAIYKQLTTLEHVLFGGFTHEPAIELGDLITTSPDVNLDSCLFIVYTGVGPRGIRLLLRGGETGVSRALSSYE